MLKNYFKIALRNLKTNKGYTLLNLFGLVTGLTCCLVLFQYVAYQKSFDAFNSNAGQIARLSMDFHDQGKLTMQSATVFPGVAPMMKNDFPEVKNYCRLVSARVGWWGVEPAQWNVVLSNDDQSAKGIENEGFYADPSFLQMFTVSFLKGDANNALDGPNKMVISRIWRPNILAGPILRAS